MFDLISFALKNTFLSNFQMSILKVSSIFSFIDTNSTKIKSIAHIFVNIYVIPNDLIINSFRTYLSITNKNKIHISYNAIFDIIFDRTLLLILLQPFSFTLLNIPVKVSNTIAAATDIKRPCIGTNNNTIDDNI